MLWSETGQVLEIGVSSGAWTWSALRPRGSGTWSGTRWRRPRQNSFGQVAISVIEKWDNSK